MKYLKDMRGRVVQAPQYKPTADQNPNGRAAKRRRKQMERQLQKAVGPIELVAIPPIEAGCDACGVRATARCPFCQAATCGKCQVCEHGPQIPASQADAAADSSEAPRADRQEIAPAEYIVDPTTQHATLEELYGDASGYQRRLVNQLADNASFAIVPPTPSDIRDIFVGVDLGRPEGDVTTVAIRKGEHVIVIDEYGAVPAEAWDDVVKRARDKVDDTIAAELGGGKPPPVNRARALALSGARHSLVLGALLAMTMGTDKPKE